MGTDEKETLDTIFSLRAGKLNPYIEAGDFSKLKSSGVSIRLYDDIIENIDFENEIWNKNFDAQDPEWLNFILDKITALP